MDIHYAILGMLNWKPMTGYDLKKIIADSNLFYWSGNNNQIYYSLVHLHQLGLVSQNVEYQENLPARKTYSITPRGKLQLRDWALGQPELPEIRNAFLVQLAWGDLLSDEELDNLLAVYLEELEVQVQMRIEQIGRADNFPERTPREKLLWQRLHENILGAYQNELAWVRQLRSDLKCLDTT